MGIEGEIIKLGLVDSEMDNIRFILNQSKSGAITPQKSLKLKLIEKF